MVPDGLRRDEVAPKTTVLVSLNSRGERERRDAPEWFLPKERSDGRG
jgi:hypothetical protein